MKAIKFISALALVLGLAACDSYDLPNPPGQTYPEPDGYFENSGIVLSRNTETLNLTAANEANEYVTVATIDELINFPSDDYELVIDMMLSGTAGKSTILSTTIEDNSKVTVNPDLLNAAIQEVVSKKPGTYTLPVAFYAYAERGTTRMGLGGMGATYGNGDMTIISYDAAKVIEDAYYLVPVAAGNPAFDKAVRMNNTAGNSVSPYDNPEFAVQLEIPEDAEYYFMIAPASAVDAKDASGLYGALPVEDGMSGKLGTSYSAIEMPIAGSVLVTVNMELDSYTVNYAFDAIYAVSGSTKPADAMALYTNNYINYYGVTALNQRFTIYTQVDKKGVIFKIDSDVPTEVSEDGLEATGGITSNTSASGQIPAPVKGNCLYYVDINLVLKTYTLKALQTLGVVGNHNGWNEKESLPLTASKDLKIWTATDVELDGDFKINANGAWAYDFGGAQLQDVDGQLVYTLDFKGSNMSAPKGKYDVKIDFSSLPYTLTLTAK